MKIGKFRVSKKAVSPVIATLLMIAVAVAASVIVYVWSAGLLGTLMGGGGAQVKEQLIIEAYDWTGGTLDITLRNVGSTKVTVDAIYVGGTAMTSSSPALPQDMDVKDTLTIDVTPGVATVVPGTAYTVKIVTVTGGVFSFSCIAGSSG